MAAMSSRTKSFFEQDHKQKVKFPSPSRETSADALLQPRPGQWHRRDQRPPLGEMSGNNAPPKPPIPPTSQAKSKLKAFQFVSGQPDELQNDDNREESVTGACEDVGASRIKQRTTNGAATSNEKGAASLRSGDDKTANTTQLPHANTFPSTPGTRLPLEDLIGNFEENAKPDEPQEVSPEEHIGWIPNSSSTLLTPGRKRKRARSSSPSCPNTSSQRQDASVFFSNTAAQGERESPEADPAANLWQRYATGEQTDEALKPPDLSNLMFQASPRALETPLKSGGLRRWASTGYDWPSSKNKRRRTDGRTSIRLWQDQQTNEPGGKSKVAAMVEKLQESLASQKIANPKAKPEVRIEGPSSSSPLPDVGAADAFSGAPAASPLQARQQRPLAQLTNGHADTSFPMTGGGPVRQQPACDGGGASDRPAGGIKEAQLAPDAVISAPLHLQSKGPLPAYKRPSIVWTPSSVSHQQQHKVASSAAVLPAANEDLAQFGDDLDFSAEDLEELLTQPPPLHQRPLHQIPPHPNPPQQQQYDDVEEPSVPQHGSSHLQPVQLIDFDDGDDEFGCDDIDEACFAQVEFKAAQASRASLLNANYLM